MTLANPCRKKDRKYRMDKPEPFNVPSDCGEDAWWDEERLNCQCKDKGAKWNATKKQCDCLNPDTEWIKSLSTCKCRNRRKELNKKGECVCITDPTSLWVQDFGAQNDCPKPQYDPDRRYYDFPPKPTPWAKMKEEGEDSAPEFR
ncbi:hypothetical protein Neosp_009908 [[Neocosmospora] mangrovei]